MLTSILIGAAVFAAQIALYNVVTRKLAERKRIKERLAGIRTMEHKPRPAPQRFINRPGEN